MSEVALSRRVTFSSGHRYWALELDPEANRARFGRWASPFNHGHNYVLWTTFSGQVDPSHGMVVNIKLLDDLLRQRIVQPFDQKSLNDEVPEFAELPPTLENLLRTIRDRLAELPPEVRLTHLELQETETLRADWNLQTQTMTLTRTYEFAAAHRLHAEALTPERNLQLFGKCNHPNYHGHNYVLEITVTGQPDPITGMLIDLDHLDHIVEREILDRYDHRNLSLDLPEFEGKNTTSEVVAQTIFDRLVPTLPLKKVRLYETARSYFDVDAS